MASLSPVTVIRPTTFRRNSEWQELDNWNWGQKLSFVSSGVFAELRVTEPAAMAPIKLRLPPGWRPSKLSGNGLQYSVVVGSEVAPPGFERLNMLFRGTLLIAAAYELEPVMGALEADLDLRLARLAAPERIFVGAGVVEWRGRAIVIV